MDKKLISAAILGFIVGIAVGYAVWGLPSTASADVHKINICHRDEGKPEWKNIEIDEHAWEHPHKDHGDYLGKCEEPTLTPEPKLTFLCKAPEEGKANAYISGSEGFTPVEVNKGDYLFRVLNGGKGDITSYEVKLASNLIYTGGAVLAGGHDFFTVDTAMAGLTIYAQPSGQHGTSSTNETLCEMLPEPEPSPEPSPTPTPSEEPKSEVVNNTTDAPQCTDTAPTLSSANTLVWRNGGSAIVQWQPTEGDKAHVYYYENQNEGNAHAVRDTENDGYVEINELGALDWTFGVQQVNGCAGGPTVWVVDGDTAGWVLFI